MAELEQSNKLTVNVVKHSTEPKSVMTLLKLYDMKWSTKLTAAAADAEDLELLQWLHKVTDPWPQKLLNKCMCTAGRGCLKQSQTAQRGVRMQTC
jgi:hypothetical protein